MRFFNSIKKISRIFFLIALIYGLDFVASWGAVNLDIDTQGLDFDRILFVQGIKTTSLELTAWKNDLEKNFPNDEIIFMDEFVYFYWQDGKTEKIVEKGTNILNDGKSTLIIAHSYGGILAKTMIERAENANVVKLITMASPNKMESFGIKNSKEFLGTPEDVDVPTISVGGFLDPVVLFPKTNIDNSEHIDLWSGHTGFLFNKNVRQKVLELALGIKTDIKN
ncbi:MAG: hypothetical protein V1851_00880 [Patescibacteria group bacterium]